MKKKLVATLLSAAMVTTMFVGCGTSGEVADKDAAAESTEASSEGDTAATPDGNLIGVMKSYGDTTSLNPKGKGKAVLGWFAESMAIPDRTKEVRGQARVVTFEGE